MSSRVLCLSIRQPWAWAILHAGKDIENRTWSTRRRGRVLLHASKRCSSDDWLDAEEFIRVASGRTDVPILSSLELGGIVGSIEIADCVTSSVSPWFVGEYGFVLREPRIIPFTPCQGALGFFPCPDDALRSLIAWKNQEGGSQ